MMLPSTHNSVNSSLPQRMESTMFDSSRGDSRDNDGCQSRRTRSFSKNVTKLCCPLSDGPSRPNMAIDSPLHAPHSSQSKVFICKVLTESAPQVSEVLTNFRQTARSFCPSNEQW